MSVLASLGYHLKVTLAGNSALRVDRWRMERRLRRGDRRHPHLGPPLPTSPRLKELISRHYLKGRYVAGVKPVAWVTSGAPVEFLAALGFFLLYPENHGAVCGIRRTAADLAAHAESEGYSPDLCSYARTDFGALLSGETPVGRLPAPDLLVCCTNICQTVLHWYRVLAHRLDVPLVIIDTPFLYGEATKREIDYVRAQIESAIGVAERVAGRSLDPGRLERVTELAKEAIVLWMQVLQMARNRPAPISAFDEFIHMAPIVEMRGSEEAVAYYRELLGALKERVRSGTAAVIDERYRLIWDNLPVWHRVRWLAELLAERGVALVASTYTNAWGELAEFIDPRKPLDSAARVYLHPILNRGTGFKLETMVRMVDDYDADGVILHSDRSCKPYSIGQMGQAEALGREIGVPALLLEADHNDPRSFSEQQVGGRLEAFLEMLEA